MAAPHLLIAAGGTGGHMFPAQALAEAMVARGWRVTLSTDARGARYTVGFPEAVRVQRVSSATPARGGMLARMGVPVRVAFGVGSAVAAQQRDPARAVVGFGGYPSIPALAAATILRRPRMIHEANGVLGRVNAMFARRVAAVACGTWPTALPAGARGVHTGNPVRAEILARAAAPYIAPGDHPTSLLVIGGSQGARVLSDAVPDAVALLPEGIRAHLRVAHQARAEDAERVAETYAEAGIPAEVEPFFPDIARRLSEAQLVISRAGASSVADICVIGRPAILIPFAAAAADHQTANARGVVEAGAAVAVPEDALTPEGLADEMAGILGDPSRANRMVRAALALARPDATERLAEMVLDLARGDGR